MEQLRTKNSLLNSDLVRSIDSPLKAFANFINHPPNEYCKGLLYELVAASALMQLGWRWYYHRKKLAGYEVDLVLMSKTSKDILLVEVKSKTRLFAYSHLRLNTSQKKRFKKTVDLLQSRYPTHNILGLIALVDLQKVEFLFLDEV